MNLGSLKEHLQGSPNMMSTQSFKADGKPEVAPKIRFDQAIQACQLISAQQEASDRTVAIRELMLTAVPAAQLNP